MFVLKARRPTEEKVEIEGRMKVEEMIVRSMREVTTRIDKDRTRPEDLHA